MIILNFNLPLTTISRRADDADSLNHDELLKGVSSNEDDGELEEHVRTLK